jgi:D-arabinose 1-dehydrogenase-like Zn-dependent alcohol dehydrogenase
LKNCREQNSALFDVELSEVCGTDVYLQKGLLHGVPYPLVPGHVSVGRLSEIRGKLFDVEGREFREGDRVTFSMCTARNCTKSRNGAKASRFRKVKLRRYHLGITLVLAFARC